MGKPNKSVWIYASAMFIMAIALILLTTLTQNRTGKDGEKFVLSEVFNSTAQQRIAMVSDENLQLKDIAAQQAAKISKYEEQIAQLTAEKQKSNSLISVVGQLYTAYSGKKYEDAAEILTKITKEEADSILPGLYDNAKKAVDNYIKK